jgi:hypothetical protein
MLSAHRGENPSPDINVNKGMLTKDLRAYLHQHGLNLQNWGYQGKHERSMSVALRVEVW